MLLVVLVYVGIKFKQLCFLSSYVKFKQRLKPAYRAMVIKPYEARWLRFRKKPLPAGHVLKSINTARLNLAVTLEKFA